jgi:hypothetical protein
MAYGLHSKGRRWLGSTKLKDSKPSTSFEKLAADLGTVDLGETLFIMVSFLDIV